MNTLRTLAIISLITLFFHPNIGFAQKTEMMEKHRLFNEYVAKGGIEQDKENYLIAISYFDSASAIFPGFHKPYFYKVLCCIKLNDFHGAYDNLKKQLLTGVKSSFIPQILGDFVNSSLYKTYLQEEDSIYNTVLQRYDAYFCSTLEDLIRLNQENLKRPLAEKDTTIFLQLVNLCKKYGFPSYYNGGTYLYRGAANIIRSSQWYGYPDSKAWQEILALMEKEELRGHIEVAWRCEWEDWDLYDKKRPLKYAVLFHLRKPDMIYPPLDELNRYRAAAGLADFQLQMQYEGINLDEALLQLRNGQY